MIVVWKRPPRSGPHTPLVVLLHGRGADEHDLVPVAERLPRALTYAALRGFVELPEGGFTWFENRGVARPIGKSIRESAARLLAWLDAAASPTAPVFLLGFSAGMMMAGALLLEAPQRFAGAVLLSGALPLDSGLDAEPQRLAGLPVFYGRGTADDVIPADLVARSEAVLRAGCGERLVLREYAHGHTIALREIHDIAAWLDER